jgi:hypothetical protein
VEGGWNLNFIFRFIVIETAHEQLDLGMWSLVQQKYLQVLFESLFCFMKLLNMAMVRNFEILLTNAETL